jgi:hypothetical protein
MISYFDGSPILFVAPIKVNGFIVSEGGLFEEHH